jgi:hypothetical protein
MPYGSYSTPINASPDRIWEAMLDKAHRPHKYIPFEVLDYKIHEEFPGGILREIRTAAMHMIERVTFDRKGDTGTVTFTLVNHPIYDGTISNHLAPPDAQSGGQPVVTYTMDVQARSPELEKGPEAEWFIHAAKPEAVAKAVLHLKQMLEGEAKQEAKA